MIARLAVRILIILVAAGVVSSAVYWVEHATVRESIVVGMRRTRPLSSRPDRVVEFAEELVIIGAIALIGRKVLKLRL